MTRDELVQRLGISDQKLEKFKLLVREEIQEMSSAIEDRIPDLITITNDDDWDAADELAQILIREIIGEGK